MKKSNFKEVSERLESDINTLHPTAFTAARRAMAVIKLMADSNMDVPAEEVEFMLNELDENVRRLKEAMGFAPEKGKKALESAISTLEFMRSKIEPKRPVLKKSAPKK